MPGIIVAAVEAGGTTFVVCTAEVSTNGKPRILHRREVESSHSVPKDTIQQCIEFFEDFKPQGGYDAIGVASFGPVGLNENEKHYGCILPGSPKAAWRNVNLLEPFVKACKGTKNLAVKIETDVNAPAFAEYLEMKDFLSSVAYVTVGTGVGVGLVVNGSPVHGWMHPEGGHVPVQPLPGDNFKGYTWGEKAPFNGRNTVEGISSSVALTERLEMITGKRNLSRASLASLDDDHELWDHAANALANLATTLILTASVEKIVFGGGVMKRKCLLEMIRERTMKLLNGYIDLPDLSTLITESRYGSDVGLISAILMAHQAHNSSLVNAKVENEVKLMPYREGFLHGLFLGGLVAVGGILFIRGSSKR